MKRIAAFLFLLLVAETTFAAFNEPPLKIGLLAFRPEMQARATWQPLANHLETTLKQTVELQLYDHTGLEVAVAQRAVDLVVTSPGQFLMLQHTSGLSSSLATLVAGKEGQESSAYGGVIVTLAERDDIASLRDLIGKHIGAISLLSFGGYQAQAFELLEAGVSLQKDDYLHFLGQPHDQVIAAVVAGRVDVGFVQSGLIESMAREGRLDPSLLKIINRQNLPGFPNAVSTRLYPQWAVAVMPQVDKHLASHIAAALLAMPHGSLGADAEVNGFEIPANYEGIEQLLHRLRLPPFDGTPEILLADIWQHYAAWILAMTALLLLLVSASIGLIVLYQRTHKSAAAITELNALLEDERSMFIGGPSVAFKWRAAEGWPVEYVSPNVKQRFGYSPEDFTSGKIPYTSIVHPDDLESVLREMEIHSDSDVPFFDHEYRIRCVDGKYRWVFDFTLVKRDSTDRVIYYHAHLNDISKLKKAEKKLHRYRENLEETVHQRTSELILARDAAQAANKAKTVFLANMSHELRTPLNAILGFSAMMRKDPLLPESEQQKIDIINRSGEHLLSLINDVLEMAKIEAGRVQLENRPFDLGAIVRDTTDMMEVRAQSKGLSLLIDQSSVFPSYIFGDEARLRQILINLLGNAIKFTQQGSITLRLGTRQKKVAHLLIEVEDTGIGISPEDQQHIFEPFVQLGEHGINKGSGLGLTITHQFVQMMDGNINLQSELDKGSIFTIELPLQEASEEDISKPDQITTGSVSRLAAGQPEYRILIVEDQRDNQLLLSKLMQSVGLQVKMAENGEQAVQLFQSWQPHFIWMDRRMPVMDGMQATQHIRQLPNGKQVKIIALTASAFDEERNEVLAIGMDDFVRKPFRASEIYDCLSKHLGVQYLYQDTVKPQQKADTLTSEKLAVLPQALRQQLRDALESLDSTRITAIISKISETEAELASTLSNLTKNYDYQPILIALGGVIDD